MKMIRAFFCLLQECIKKEDGVFRVLSVLGGVTDETACACTATGYHG